MNVLIVGAGAVGYMVNRDLKGVVVGLLVGVGTSVVIENLLVSGMCADRRLEAVRYEDKMRNYAASL